MSLPAKRRGRFHTRVTNFIQVRTKRTVQNVNTQSGNEELPDRSGALLVMVAILLVTTLLVVFL